MIAAILLFQSCLPLYPGSLLHVSCVQQLLAPCHPLKTLTRSHGQLILGQAPATREPSFAVRTQWAEKLIRRLEYFRQRCCLFRGALGVAGRGSISAWDLRCTRGALFRRRRAASGHPCSGMCLLGRTALLQSNATGPLWLRNDSTRGRSIGFDVSNAQLCGCKESQIHERF